MIATARILDLFPDEVFCRDNEDRVALHYAAETADPETFKRILEMDNSLIHCQDKNGYTPLLIASMSGNVPAIRLMIESGIQINHVDKEKHSAVHWAVVCGQGAQAVHYAAAAEDISLERCEAMLHILLKYGAKVNARDIDGRTPILWAATYGSLEIAIILLQTGGDMYAVDRDQLGTIHCAASHGHAHIIEYLINTLDSSVVNSVDRNGDTALFYAVTLGHYECARLLLLNGAEVNHQDRYLRCPVHCAAAKGQLRMLKLLRHFGGSYEIQNRRGDLPIHEAIQASAKDCVEYLLASHPSSINVSNHEGRTGLHLAAASGNMEIVILLCTRNALVNPLMLYQDTLLTPLDLAVQKNHELIVEYLRLRQDAKLAEELSEETRRQAKSHLKHRILEEGKTNCISDPILKRNLLEAKLILNVLARVDRQKGVSPNGNRFIVGSTQMESVCQETQTSMRACRAAATNTSRPESPDNTGILKTYQSSSPVQQLLPKATSTEDLEQYLSEKQLQDDVCLKNEEVREINGDHWLYDNYWTSEDGDMNFEDANRIAKSSRNILSKSRSGYHLQLKQLKENERLYGKIEGGERMKKKLAQLTRIDGYLSGTDNDKNNGKQVNDKPESGSVYGTSKQLISEQSVAAMNIRSQKVPTSADRNSFKEKLEKSLGSLQVDIYRTEFGEVTMQQRLHKNKRIGRCYAHEEAIFNELTHLKKMQLQYDQLKLLYLEERNHILNSHHSHYSPAKYKPGLQRKQVHQDNTILSTITEGTRSAHSDSSQTVLCTGEKRCNCLYNRRDLL
ncbi:unnamed protein product [Acanthocheilonema viteae]|uniref:Uncharacterized protein n=1 Tax=Acanthocheilonema viteae TaxID=6277 RepID=A0A498S694_ACAVI|nr:unnamed protein product [Acanthocheilonema viteae]